MQQDIDLHLWVTLAVVMVVFIVLPGVALEYERRKRERSGRPAVPPGTFSRE
jgi:hypothetical protein